MPRPTNTRTRTRIAPNTCTAPIPAEVSANTLHRYLVAEWTGAIAQFARAHFAQTVSERDAAQARIRVSLDRPQTCTAPTT